MNNNNINNLSLIFQMISLELLFQDYNNSDLMQELQRQDNEYLEKIIKNQDSILAILRKEGNLERESNKGNRN